MRTKFLTSCVLLASILIVASLMLTPYKDMRQFNERYMALGAGDSDLYWDLREEMLTPKYQLLDYGITLLTLALVFHFVSRTGHIELNSPKRAATLVALAVSLPVVSVAGYVFDLYQAFLRGEFPHWADSLGIPLMGVPLLFVYMLGWSLLHLIFLRGGHRRSTLRNAVSRKSNSWLLLLSSVTMLFTLATLSFGQYWYAVPGAMWLYYYLSLAAGRRAAATRAVHDT